MIFDDNEILIDADDTLISQWCDKHILSPYKYCTVKTRLIEYNAICHSTNVFSTNFFIKDGIIQSSKYLAREDTSFVFMNYDGEKLPDFIKFDDYIGEIILINCPNLIDKYLPTHMELKKFNNNETFIYELFIKNIL